MATKKYESMRIISLEGSVLYKNMEGFTALKNGKPNSGIFRGILDESLDTLKIKEVYERHKETIGFPYIESKKRFCRAVVNLSFNRAIKVYESYGNRYVLNGHSVTDEDMTDHTCIRTIQGVPTLVAIEISYKERTDYLPVETPITANLLGKAFLSSAAEQGYEPAREALRSIEQGLNARIVIGVCDLFYYASLTIDERCEDMYSSEHTIDYHGIDKKQRRENQAKRDGIMLSY